MNRKDELFYTRNKIIKQVDELENSLIQFKSSLKEIDAELKQILKDEYQEVLNNVTEGRKKFIYNNGYGLTTDIYLLPVGIKFYVHNGAWNGEIIEEDGKKTMLINATGKKVVLEEDFDYCLVISVRGEDSYYE